MTEEEALVQFEKMIYGQCKKWRSHIFYDDLLQECKLAICIAVREHDPKIATLSTFIHWRIKGAISNNLRKWTGYNYYQSKKDPNYTKPQFVEMGEWTKHSLDQTDFEFDELIKLLPDESQPIFLDRFKNNLSYDDLGLKYKLTGERIRQIIKRGCKKLRRIQHII
jgi:RNA polymerase sigma factor (sigma-70 family)